MWKKIVIALVTGIIFLSCARNADSVKTADTTNRETPDSQASNVLVYQMEEESIKDLLYAHEKEWVMKWNASVLSLRKVNFGIPGGDNWLAEWSDNETRSYTNLIVYLIDGHSIKSDYNFGLNDNKNREFVQNRYDIMRDIPGAHIGNGTSSIGDFNSDGLDEVFKYAFGGMGNFIFVTGYDSTADEFRDYCRIPFAIIDPENGPAPVVFMTYKGMDGFKVYFFEPTVAGGPTLPPDPANPNNGKWIFYTWDETKREYVEMEEVVE
jgi:hypothetical protein